MTKKHRSEFIDINHRNLTIDIRFLNGDSSETIEAISMVFDGKCRLYLGLHCLKVLSQYLLWFLRYKTKSMVFDQKTH